MKRICTVLLTSLLLSMGSAVALADDGLDDLRDDAKYSEWRMIKNDISRRIKAWDKRDLGKDIRSFKLDQEIEAPLDVVLRAYLDIDYYPRWFWEVQEAKVLKKVSDTEFYYYLVHRAPFGFPPHDVIIHMVIEPLDAKRGFVTFKLEAKPDYIPRRQGHIRMLAEDMVIKWTPLANGRTREEVEGYVDPGDKLPAWAINSVQRLAPYYTAIGLQRIVKTERFKNPKEPIPFRIRE